VGADTIEGGNGYDTVIGGAGNDVFRYTTVDGLIDGVTDFSLTATTAGGKDTLDISSLLTGYVAGTEADFVRVFDQVIAPASGTTAATGNTAIQVDVDGAGGPAGWVDLCVLQGVTGKTLTDLTPNIDFTP
jgi:Ca2+-binding RTX toxin-like protein